MKRAAALAVLVLALTGCDGGTVQDNGDGSVTVPWWLFWQNQQTHTETRYVPAPGPVTPPRVQAPAQPRQQAPAPRVQAPAPRVAPPAVRTR